MSNQIAKIKDFKEFQGYLARFQPTIEKMVLDAGITPAKFVTIVENSVRRIPKLLECKPASLFGAILTAAELGLEPNTPNQYSYIIPYGSEAQFQIGYHGIIKMLMDTGLVTHVSAELVHENDKFTVAWDSLAHEKRIKEFEPVTFGDKGQRIGCFAVIHLSTGGKVIQILDKTDIEAIKKKSKSPQTYNEANDPMGWMWKKAAIRQAGKLVKGSRKFDKAISLDAALDGGRKLRLNDEATEVEIIEEPDFETQNAGEAAKDLFNENKQ
jgi:recombination protein RecT